MTVDDPKGEIMFMLRFGFLLVAVVWLLTMFAAGSEIAWTRLRGRVKAVDVRAHTITLQNSSGDLLTLTLTPDIEILHGKEVVPIERVFLDDKVTLLYAPQAPQPAQKAEPEPPEGQPYPPLKR